MVLVPTMEIGIWNAWVFMSAFIFQMIVIMFAGKQISERSHIPNNAKKTIFEKYIAYFPRF